MIRNLILGSIVFVAASFCSASIAEAAPFSPNNPYRSFNISGVNYGSQSWERQHRGMRGGYGHRGVFFRRR